MGIDATHRALGLSLLVLMATASTADATLIDGLRAAYFFSGNANDATGNGNDGVVNGAQLATDRNGNEESAYSFDGVNDFIDIGNGVKPSLPLSVNLWFSADTVGVFPMFRNDRYDGGSFRNGVFLGTSDNQLFVQVLSGFAQISTRKGVITANDVFVANEWNMFTAVFDGITDFRIYLNGFEQLVAPTTGTGNTLTYSSGNGAIGNVNNTANNAGVFTSNFFDGLLDDIRIYDRVLSDQEIMNLVDAPSNLDLNPIPVPQPPALWLFAFGIVGILLISRGKLMGGKGRPDSAI